MMNEEEPMRLVESLETHLMVFAAEDARQGPALQVDRAVAAVAGRLVSDRIELCPSGVCRAYEAGLWRYRDGLHISPQQSRDLGEILAAQLD